MVVVQINERVFVSFFRYDRAILLLVGRQDPKTDLQAKAGPWKIELTGLAKLEPVVRECFLLQYV